MALRPAARILGNGLAHLPRRNALSRLSSQSCSSHTDRHRALSNTSSEAGLKVYVTGDAPDVYEDKLLNIAKAGTKHFHPTLLLVGTRLGIDRITPAYREALKAILQMPQSVGIAG